MKNSIKDEINGGYYCSYASGDRAISFTHCNHHGNADAIVVSEEIARRLMPDGYILNKENGQWKARTL